MYCSQTLKRNLRTLLLYAIALLLASAATACRTRTIYVPDGCPVRIRETVRNVKVWVPDAEGKWIEGRADLLKGWYAMSDPGPGGEADE